MLLRKIAFVLSFFFSVSAAAQIPKAYDTGKPDTLFFLNGEISTVKVIDTLYHTIKFLPGKKTKKPHVREVEKDRVFSLKYSSGQEKIFYTYDTTLGNVFSVLEAKMFMLGEQEAEKSYRNKWPALIGLVGGVVSPLVLSNAVLLSPIPAVVVPLHTLIPTIKINTKEIRNKNYLQYDTYLMGYEKVARKKNFMRSITGAGIGLLAGLGLWTLMK
jgi:hypothetical protein